ncbi:Fungal hydrophobin-like protein 3 [Elsinoe fawcettii]|nr:Fungal hydrophobin-like protein 3 [Elsinoe fawcettii]
MTSALFAVLLAIVTVAFAAPTAGSTPGMTVQQAAQQCGNEQQISCCNNSDGSSTLLGANCVSVPILAIPIGQQCQGNNVAACCDGDSNGSLINLDLSCTPISL